MLANERSLRAAAEAKAAKREPKPKLPPDEVRDNQIKRLHDDKRKLKAKVHAIWQASNMPFKTKAAIAKVLQPDSTTKAEKADALKLFNAFISDARTAGRHL